MLKLQSIKAYVEVKLGQKGAAIVEYALLLAFVAIIGAVLLGDNGLSDHITTIINNITGLMGTAAENSTAK